MTVFPALFLSYPNHRIFNIWCFLLFVCQGTKSWLGFLPSMNGKQPQLESNQQMQESNSCSLPFGDRAIRNVIYEYIAYIQFKLLVYSTFLQVSEWESNPRSIECSLQLFIHQLSLFCLLQPLAYHSHIYQCFTCYRFTLFLHSSN